MTREALNELIAHSRQELAGQPRRVFKEEEIWQIVTRGTTSPLLPDEYKPISENLGLERSTVIFERYKEKRYHWPNATGFELAYSLSASRGYLSHLTALAFHGLYPEPLQEFIVNEEQSPKPSSGQLTQSGLDNAFRRPQRISNHVGRVGERSFMKINGKHTQNADVIEAQVDGYLVRVTSIARTLVDCVVRPIYGCSPLQLVQAFRLAGEREEPHVLVKNIISLLPKLGHKYPYHQTLGFYLQYAFPKFPESTWNPFLDLGLDFDFYLTYEMVEPYYSEKWRLSYPMELGPVAF